ncbi:MAG: transposase [Pseudomonadota bacterium]|nr:transposase [Pseudomonadota bacterium]
MARLPRYVLPGHPQHVIQRGNNRSVIFAAEQDYRFYLEKLEEACKQHHCDVHAYVLMTNHVHLLITPQTGKGLGKAMQSLGRRYVQYFNYQYRRTGTLWEGRYRATLVDSENYLLTCYRYIELNPVRAGMVTHPSEYPWSSYHANATGRPDGLVTRHELYRRLGRGQTERLDAYRQLFEQQLSAPELTRIRNATNKAWVLGNRRFREQIEAIIDRQTSPTKRGGDRKSADYRKATKIDRV